jgi:hypothetical protein
MSSIFFRGQEATTTGRTIPCRYRSFSLPSIQCHTNLLLSDFKRSYFRKDHRPEHTTQTHTFMRENGKAKEFCNQQKETTRYKWVRTGVTNRPNPRKWYKHVKIASTCDERALFWTVFCEKSVAEKFMHQINFCRTEMKSTKVMCPFVYAICHPNSRSLCVFVRIQKVDPVPTQMAIIFKQSWRLYHHILKLDRLLWKLFKW